MDLLSGELALPLLVLKEPALTNNISLMARYAAENGFLLAPHGKTTMAPELFRRQLDAGAWGITVANMHQASVAYEAGARRVLVANELVSRADALAMAEHLAVGGRELYCLVDSLEGARLLDANLGWAGVAKPLCVLVELGAPGGRTGARSEEEALAAAGEVARSQHLVLAGVEGYEGVLADDRSPEALARVDAFLVALRQLTARLAEAGAFSGRAALVSAGGSKYFDRAVELLGPKAQLAGGYGSQEVKLVVRAGAYVAHDHGIYSRTSPLQAAPGGTAGLQAALELWAEVLSVPEPGLAIVGLGKRDAPYDLGLPVPLGVLRGRSLEPMPGASLRGLNDQHGYLNLGEPVAGVVVGDRIAFGISHPCTAFDKWRTVLLVDANYEILKEIRTSFH